MTFLTLLNWNLQWAPNRSPRGRTSLGQQSHDPCKAVAGLLCHRLTRPYLPTKIGHAIVCNDLAHAGSGSDPLDH
jgi:hypothetical protein